MSLPKDKCSSASLNSKLSDNLFGDLLDSIIVDVASEFHRTARLGLDRNVEIEEEELRLSAEARARLADPGNGYVVDIFGQSHLPVAGDVFECMNCGQSIVAGKFAPHLEKCMGKGRKAGFKARRSSRLAQNRHSRGSCVSSNSQNSNTSILMNDTPDAPGEGYPNGAYEDP